MLFKALILVTLLKHATSSLIIDRDQIALSIGQSEFAKVLYGVLSQSDGNMLFSPMTIHTQLALLTQGTRGDVKFVLENMLGIPNDVAARSYSDKLKQLQKASTELNMHLSNVIFLKPELNVESRFAFVAGEFFNTTFATANLDGTGETADRINEVIAEKSGNRLDRYYNANDTLRLDYDMIATTVLSLNGKWEKNFNVDDTKQRNFHYCGRNYVPVEMMHIADRFKYKFIDRIDSYILVLPLTFDINFVLLLPHDCNGIKRLEKYLPLYELTKMFDDLETVNIDLWLPKFTIDDSHDLRTTLDQIGFHQLFSDSELDNVANAVINSTTIFHKAHLDMNEQGVEVSARAMGYEDNVEEEEDSPLKFEANHPFVFMLTQGGKYDNIILFMGRFSMPNIN